MAMNGLRFCRRRRCHCSGTRQQRHRRDSADDPAKSAK